MTKNKKRIAIATSGGDAPGMNACIRAAVIECINNDIQPIGVRKGALGLIRNSNDDFFELTRNDVRNIIERGSSILGSAREEDYIKHIQGEDTPSYTSIAKAIASNLKKNEIDSLILLGGDTTCNGSRHIWLATEKSIPVVVIPASIDNDIAGTNITIGYDTALHETAQYVDKIRETARAFDRVFIIETMGNTCGLLAAETAVITGAEELLVPEVGYSYDDIKKLCGRVLNAHRSVLIIVAEGTKLPKNISLDSRTPAEALTRYLAMALGDEREVRLGNPGYIVRGASPTAFSRLLGLKAGAKAVEVALAKNTSGHNFNMIKFDRDAKAEHLDVSAVEKFNKDQSLLIKNLVEAVEDQSY